MSNSFVEDFKVFEDPSGLSCIRDFKSQLGSDRFKSPISVVRLGTKLLFYMFGAQAVNNCEISKNL